VILVCQLRSSLSIVLAHLLGIKTDDKRRDIDDLSADTNMPLSDQHPGVMDALGQTSLEHLRLQPSLQEIFNLQGEHVIQTHPRLVEHTDTDQTTNEGISLEETLGIFRF
jgi:hypothetical protein